MQFQLQNVDLKILMFIAPQHNKHLLFRFVYFRCKARGSLFHSFTLYRENHVATFTRDAHERTETDW